MKELAKNLPETPGVYKMKDTKGNVIYIGKAKNLRKRVKTYFRPEYEHSTRTRKMLEHTADIEYTETDSELEALLLENNLIKELRPKYNILMKDDKSYVYIKIDLAEDFPRIRVIRERELMKMGRQPGAKYFGPKLASSRVYETLRILKKLFPFRHCNLDIKWKKEGKKVVPFGHVNEVASLRLGLVEVTNRVIDFPCLDYFIKRCPGPCIGAVAPIEYKKIVQQIVDFLGGKSEDLEKSLKTQMAEAASQKLFEKAGRIRDKLFALQEITERQKITDPERKDTDVINFFAEMGHVYFNVFMIRNGKLVNQENFTLDAFELSEAKSMADEVAPSGRNNYLASLRLGLDDCEILESFLTQYYEKAADIPKEILVPLELASKETFEDWLVKERGDKVHILHPKKGEKNKLLELSLKNAVSFSKQYRLKWLAQERGETALARLAEVLGLKISLKRIEGYDISHLGGNETVGSMVVFENGAPKSSDYRHFKLRTVSGKPDDYRSMEEVLMRRLKYLASKKTGFTFRKPSKKIFENIKDIIAREPARLESGELNQKTFTCLFQKNELTGFARLIPVTETCAQIKSLWIDPRYRGEKRGYDLMRRIMEKSKSKKFYVYIKEALEAYYAEFGFLKVKEAPNFMKERIETTARECCEEGILMVMEKKRLKTYDDPSFSKKPDLLVIDGGKGQLSTALLALKRLHLEIPVIALAKRLEEIYLPKVAQTPRLGIHDVASLPAWPVGRRLGLAAKAPLLLEEGDEALKLLQRIRDESHRFAITFQRQLHRKSLLWSHDFGHGVKVI